MIPLYGNGSIVRAWHHPDSTASPGLHINEHGGRNPIQKVSSTNEARNKDVFVNVLRCYVGKDVPLEDYTRFNFVRLAEEYKNEFTR